MRRIKIKKLIGKTIADVMLNHERTDIVFIDERGKIMFGVNVDQLFDRRGMFFDIEEIK